MLKELEIGDKITDFFVCSNKSVRVDRNGNKFLSLRLSDASGNIGAVMWDVADSIIDSFSQGDIVRVQGIVTSDNRGQTQLKLDRLRTATEEDEFDLSSLLPASQRSVEEMEAELAEIRASIGNPDLAALLDLLFDDPVMYRAFCDSPAAKGFHHNYIHGLLEHSLSVCRVADAAGAQYPGEVNRDLLVTGALLHDIGKTAEFEYTTAIDYSDSGRLLGHIVLGEKMVADAIHRMEAFPRELELQLLHLILAHHGEYEYGSPRRPKTLEAFILNHADDIDAKANVIMRIRTETGEPWSEYNRVLERFLYLRRAEE